MTWLIEVLENHKALDLGNPHDRAHLVESILESLPKDLIRDAIAGSAKAVLSCHGVAGHAALAMEVGRNAAQVVLLDLAIPDDEEIAIVGSVSGGVQ